MPLLIAATLLGVVVYLFNSLGSDKKTLGEAQIQPLADLDGVETEAAFAPDGTRLVAVASGELWMLNLADGSRTQMTRTPEPESFPSWTADGLRFTFSRGKDTYQAEAGSPETASLFKEDATFWSWSPSGRAAFIRNRALWITDGGGLNERELVPADADEDITIRNPRFAPDSNQLAYVKSSLGLEGDVWLVDANSGDTRPIVADRWAENPMDVGWLAGGTQMVYLTNRSGAFALWMVDLAENTIAPLTVTLQTMPLAPLGIAVWNDRIVLPRHFVDSNIVTSDGATVAGTPDIEYEPAVSSDGMLVAYTVVKDRKSEIWTVGADGSNPAYRALGSQPRFSPNNFQIVYTQTDIQGNIDLRKVDIRDGSSESVTDALEVDFESDWSRDGRSIVFSSGRSGAMSLWVVPAVGGKKLQIHDAGYFPRFLPDGNSILFWSKQAIWKIPAAGGKPELLRGDSVEPGPAVWINGAARLSTDAGINGGKAIWPAFDVFPDGRLALAPVEVQETGLWSVDLTYVIQ